MKRNILVQYQGGGYDGCFWEWNYFYIDKGGKFWNIYSSGRDGIETIEQADKLLEQGIQVNDYKWTIALKCGSYYTYDMSKEEDIREFVKESNVVNVTGVLQFFEDNADLGVEFFALCSGCREKITDLSEAVLENWHGCGGIQLTADVLLCRECYQLGYCDCCREYIGETEIVEVNPDEHHGFDRVCADCKVYHDKERREQAFEDLRWKSFTTGKPDMFSGEMRERRLEGTGGL